MPPVSRVLVYRLGSLGDTVIALPFFHLVERAFPSAERRLLTNIPVHAKAPAAEAILGESGLVDGYFQYPVGTRNPLRLLALCWKIRRWSPDVLIYASAARGIAVAKRDARFFRLCGIRRIIGVPVTDAMQLNLFGESSASGNEIAHDQEPEAARLVRNVSELGDAQIDTPEAWDLRLTTAEHARAAEVTRGSTLSAIAVSLGTKVQSKDWGIDNWQALLAKLSVRFPGYALWLVGAPEEHELSEAASRGWTAGPVTNLCGALTPRETAAVLARARLFLGHDSGPMHLAAAVQTPCVAIFAARNLPRVWFPWGKQHRVLYHPVSCMGCGLETCIVEAKRCILSITAEEALSAVNDLLR